MSDRFPYGPFDKPSLEIVLTDLVDAGLVRAQPRLKKLLELFIAASAAKDRESWDAAWRMMKALRLDLEVAHWAVWTYNVGRLTTRTYEVGTSSDLELVERDGEPVGVLARPVHWRTVGAAACVRPGGSLVLFRWEEVFPRSVGLMVNGWEWDSAFGLFAGSLNPDVPTTVEDPADLLWVLEHASLDFLYDDTGRIVAHWVNLHEDGEQRMVPSLWVGQ